MLRQFVFGYGSLAAVADGHSVTAELRGHQRTWGVAMDNRRDLPGYKYYTDAASGERPAVFVAFLDLVEDPEGAVRGLCLPVDERGLALLDRRERNYERVEVTARIVISGGAAGAAGATVWAYVGSAAGRGRLAEGRRRGIAVIDAAYLRAVQNGLRTLGEAAYRASEGSLDPIDLPVMELQRHELPDEY